MPTPKLLSCPHCGVDLPKASQLPFTRERRPPKRRDPREDPFLPLVIEWMRGRTGDVTVRQVLVGLGIAETPATLRRMGRTMVYMGLVRKRLLRDGQRTYTYVRADAPLAPPAPAPAPKKKAPHTNRRRQALVDAVSRWLLDVGDSPVALDEVLAGLNLPFTHGERCRVGSVLHKELGRERVRRMVDGRPYDVYVRTTQPPPRVLQ